MGHGQVLALRASFLGGCSDTIRGETRRATRRAPRHGPAPGVPRRRRGPWESASTDYDGVLMHTYTCRYASKYAGLSVVDLVVACRCPRLYGVRSTDYGVVMDAVGFPKKKKPRKCQCVVAVDAVSSWQTDRTISREQHQFNRIMRMQHTHSPAPAR